MGGTWSIKILIDPMKNDDFTDASTNSSCNPLSIPGSRVKLDDAVESL